MLTNLIESRGKEFSNLLKIGDYLGRSLRENVELFYVEDGKVTYLTESNKVVTANYSFKPYPKLTNIQVDDSSILENRGAFEKVVDKKVCNLLSNLLEDSYEEADNTFSNILGLFETKLSYDRIKERLQEKTERFGPSTKIMESVEFAKVFELKDKLVTFLKENKKLVNIPEIKNALKLASVVSKAFNMPKITLESLQKNKTFAVRPNETGTIYEHLCRQELVAKELLDAKDNFETTWANNELISNLATQVYEQDQKKVMESVANIVTNIPYFALATKKQLNTLISNCLSMNETDVSNKDISTFVGRIFEMKKPVKEYVIELLNDKYGININNLTDVPTYSNLIKTESLILTSLSKLAPKNSVLKNTLAELADSLKVKNGVESIDLVDFLNEVFTEAGYKEAINETSLMAYMDFNKVADDLGKIGTILKMMQPMLQGGGQPGMPMQQPQMGGAPPITPAPEMGKPDIDAPPMDDVAADQEGDAIGDPAQDPMAAAAGAQEEMEGEPDGDEGEMEPPMEGGEEPPMPGMEDEGAEYTPADDLTNLMSSIEDLIASIKTEIGDVDGGEVPVDAPIEGEEGDMPPMEGEEPSIEGEESGPPMEGEEGEAPEEDEGGEESEDEESEEGPPKKFPPKK